MEALIYIGKVSLYWIAFYTCYWIFLRRSTFFIWNRAYLLVALLGAFILPFLSYPSSVPVMSTAVYAVTVLPVSVSANVPKAESAMMDWQYLLWGTYIVGVVFMTIRLLSNLKDLHYYIKQGEVIEMDGFKLVLLPSSSGGESISSFSFLNWVVITQEDYESHLDEIMRHELVHVGQRHTFDVLLVEVLRILFWFNPVLIFYKSSLQQLHEYLADQETADRDEYAEFLVAYSMGVPVAMLANHFFNSALLKERITMLYKKRNSRWLLGRYFIVIPLVGMVFMLTAARERLVEAIDAGKFISKDFYNSTISKSEVLAATPEEKAALIGSIMDEEGNRLAGAHVVVKGGSLGATTDVNGRFSLGEIPLNSSVVVSFIGYEYQEFVVSKKKQIVRVKLKRKIESLEEVLITGNPAEIPDATLDKAMEDEENVLAVVEENPEFPGGISSMYQFLGSNLRYPLEAVENRIEGKVFVSFIVNDHGYIRDVKILKGLGYGTDEESVRVVLSMPKWKPARQNGKNVAVRYNLPLSFVLNKVADVGRQEVKEQPRVIMATPVYPKEKEKKSDAFSFYWHKDDAEKDMLVTFFGRQANLPLIIADGERYQGNVSSSALTSYMKEKTIMKITVLKGNEAIDKYGEDGNNGVLIMETKVK